MAANNSQRVACACGSFGDIRSRRNCYREHLRESYQGCQLRTVDLI
jgi:hypothetical protein